MEIMPFICGFIFLVWFVASVLFLFKAIYDLGKDL
jgi:hypothetical protein